MEKAKLFCTKAEFGKRLNMMRTVNGYTLENIALQLNISKQFLSQLERAQFESVNDDHIVKLATILNCTYEYLVGKSIVYYLSAPRTEDESKLSVKPAIAVSEAHVMKMRILDVCGTDIKMLNDFAICLEKATPKEKKFLKSLLAGFINMIGAK